MVNFVILIKKSYLQTKEFYFLSNTNGQCKSELVI